MKIIEEKNMPVFETAHELTKIMYDKQGKYKEELEKYYKEECSPKDVDLFFDEYLKAHKKWKKYMHENTNILFCQETKASMKGIIKGIVGSGQPSPFGFTILGDDGEDYFAHLGDLKNLEDRLYPYYAEQEEKLKLKVNDRITFSPVKHQEEHNTIHAIHVEIIEKNNDE